jgi:hypothetical protein
MGSGLAIEIDCARRDARGEITHLGGPTPDGRRWTSRLDVVIAAMEKDGARYFVSRGSQQLGLHVTKGELATMMEDGWTVHSLPACAAS